MRKFWINAQSEVAAPSSFLFKVPQSEGGEAAKVHIDPYAYACRVSAIMGQIQR